LEIEIEASLNSRSNDEGFSPIVFVPNVDLLELEDESSIDAFKKENIFVRPEEDAKEPGEMCTGKEGLTSI
jgi:hypothetical protein